MARVTPKTNWAASDTPVAPDFNRIEGNAQQAFDELDTEASTRASADSTLQSNINAEASTRASADSTLQSNINAESSTRAGSDSTLQSNINAEASTRASVDSSLQSQITSEVSNRQYYDQKGYSSSSVVLPPGGTFMVIIGTPSAGSVNWRSPSTISGGTTVSGERIMYWRLT